MNRKLSPLFAALLSFASTAAAQTPSSDTLAHVVELPPVEVSTSRVAETSPVAHTSLERAAIQRMDWGQDTPMVLGSLPGAYAYSDAGNDIGYSYLSIRGFPQRRISVLVNGVPLNDPESHEVWWIDHPDLLASTSEVQLQRGIGSALYGAAALGGTVDLTTGPMSEQPRFRSEVSGGSYGTRRVVLEGESGRTASGWDLYGRYARIQTDGYRDQSWSKLWSYALSAQHLAERQSWKVNLYGGPENTHLAYVGIPFANVDDHLELLGGERRTDNPITFPGEQDHYFEPHYELLHTWTPSRSTTVSQTLFWYDGDGYYDEQRLGEDLAGYRLGSWATSDTTQFDRSYYRQDTTGYLARDAQGRAIVDRADIVRHRQVTNTHYGWVPRARFQHARGAFTLGGELRAHDGHHVGTVIGGSGLPPGTAPGVAYYDFHPRTLAAGLFGREEWDASRAVRLTADLAWRHQDYDYRDDRFDGIAFRKRYDFLLPRLALGWTASPGVTAFASVAYASREPALSDLHEGEQVGGAELFRANGLQVEPEHVVDYELGGTWKSARASATANLFRMDFRDELVDAGQYDTDLNEPITGNAARSVHQGAELAGALALPAGTAKLELNANATLSNNHFVRFTEHWGPSSADDVVDDGKALGFFPATMAHAGARLAWHELAIGANAAYTGRIYVDNTQTKALSIPPHTVLDAALEAGAPFGRQHVAGTLRVLNATNLEYTTGGWVDYDPTTPGNWVPWLNPAALRHWIASVRVDW
jgi:iron complex outermembrane receptor protein